jgi:hypothetical protein
MKVAVTAAWAWLRSPQATRLEIALALGIFEAVRSSLGHP